ncbi:775_t:CDS:2 [Dentiscutata heterogama]|uniref:775_t:CDS:1 n=1 Tax=Dentiscutata heterogama TaxID=1316150 RepID=A0ACA9KBQ5_9GLOM|nr:775_t:CDS:2 [Dentiscutata heterogama]
MGIFKWNAPFKSLNGKDEIAFRIFRGEREKPVKNASEPYVQSYTCCWDDDPNKRPYTKELKEKPETFIFNLNIDKHEQSIICKPIRSGNYGPD